MTKTVLLAGTCLLIAPAAQAQTYYFDADFGFENTYVTVATSPSGGRVVTDIVGTYNRAPILGLVADPFGTAPAYYNMLTGEVTASKTVGAPAFVFNNAFTTSNSLDPYGVLFVTATRAVNLTSLNAGCCQSLERVFGQTTGLLAQFDGKFIPAALPAIPEPATWAMILVGFGATGVAMRRRTKVSAVRFA